nr:transposase [uncultured Lamprocystis sp.]
MTVREFQTGGKIMVTTFLCPTATPKGRLKVLYRCRWNIELDLRNMKITLGMEHLRYKTPEMALKELWVYLLAYNLIPALDGTGRIPGRPNPPPTELQTHGADLGGLAAASRGH